MNGFSFAPSVIEKNASRIFWVFVLLHIACWTILPTLVQPNIPLDTVEGFVWGREMQWGYYKHPPLQAWLLELTTYITGVSGIGYFGISALVTGIAFWAIYRTGRLFTDRTHALLATMLCEGILYFNFLAPEFNPNVLQLMSWALCSYAFAKAIIKGETKYWILLGVFFALGFYAKYAIALLGLGFGIFLCVDKEKRHLLGSYKPYLSLLICVLLLTPHLLWLWQNDFLPFTYAVSRSEEAVNLLQRIGFPLKFTISQLADMMPMLALSALVLKIGSGDTTKIPYKTLLFTFAFAPLLLNFFLSLLLGHRPLDMWGMPYLSFIPLWMMVTLKTDVTEKNLRVFATGWVCVFCLGLFAFYFNLAQAPSFGFKPLRGHFPGAALSKALRAQWQTATGKPLEYIISDAWLGGNVAIYAPDTHNRPHVFIDGNTKASPWINPGDVTAKGALVLWKDGEKPPEIFNQKLSIPESIEIPWQTTTKAPPLRIYWAILPPKNNS